MPENDSPHHSLTVVCNGMKLTRINTMDLNDWNQILHVSRAEDHNMINRLVTDFRAGTNRFDAPGEALLAVLMGREVVAVAGLNREPDESVPWAGRVRRLYVMPDFRGRGLGRRLVDAIVAEARARFGILSVNVGTSEARGFYEHLGFTPVEHSSITHTKDLAHNKSFHHIFDTTEKR